MFTVSVLMICSLAPLPAPREDRELKKEVSAYLAAKPFPQLWETVKAWKKLPKDGKARLAGLLALHLGDAEHVGLTEPQDLIILIRLGSRDLPFHGHGTVVDQDLFIVGGRAAWALSELMGVENLPAVNEALRPDERQRRVEAILTRVKRFQEGR